MAITDLNKERQVKSALVLANAVTLVSGVVQEVAGNDVSTSINGSRATTALIEGLSAQRILKKLTAPKR